MRERPTMGSLGLISHPGWSTIEWDRVRHSTLTFECECGAAHRRRGTDWQAHHGLCDGCWAVSGLEEQYEWWDYRHSNWKQGR